MERIIRSVIQIGSVPDTEQAQKNWIRLCEHPIVFYTQEDQAIHEYLQKFYNEMSAPPDLNLVKEYFEQHDNIEVVSRLEEISKAQCYVQTNFLSIVRAELEKQQTKDFSILCRDAASIAEHGRNLEKPINGKKILRGVNDAVNYMFDKLHDFTAVEDGEKLEGVASDDADEVEEEYELITKTNKYANRNLFGLEPVDSVCKGHRAGEYWIHCGFSGELKSTLAMNYFYNNTHVYGKNIFYAILEMPYTQIRRQLYAIHSSHGKFVSDWGQKDRKAGLTNPYIGIDLRKIRDGELSELEYKRFKLVSQDFKATTKGKPFIWRPKDEVSIQDIRKKAEVFHNKFGCDGIIIDHLGLVKPKYRSNDIVSRLNDSVREGRLMALNFARGKSVPILCLFQLNRQGKLRADKNDGRYDFSSISYANECCVEGTLIKTRNGLIPIELITPEMDEVWSRSGWKNVLHKFDNGRKKIINIKTDRGLVVSVTKNHRLRVFEQNHIEWKYAKDITTKDIVVLDFNNNIFPEEAPSLLPMAFGKSEKPIDSEGNKLYVHDKLTEDMAYIIGAYLGDAPSRKNVFDIVKCNKALMRWFKAMNLKREPGIPDVILKAPKAMACAFLKGFFDTDGCINSQGIISVSLKKSHSLTIYQTQILLFNLGIDSYIYFKNSVVRGKRFKSCVLRVRTRKIFSDLIGFTEPHKMKRLKGVVKNFENSEKSENMTIWPIGDIFTLLYLKYKRKYKFTSKIQTSIIRYIDGKTKGISDGAFSDFLRILKNEEHDTELQELRSFINCIPSKVVQIETVGIKKVWDLEVNGDHEYYTGGFLSHNCERSADVITYTYLNEQLRRDGKFYLGNLKNRDNPVFDRMVGKIIWPSRRMRAIENNLLDISNDLILSRSQRISRENAVQISEMLL